MNAFLWLLFIAITIIAFLPMGYLHVFKISKRYFYFRYVTIALFVWTIHTWLRFVITDGYFQYYLSMNLFPIVFLLVGMLFVAIHDYLEQPLPMIIRWIIRIFLLFELIVVNSNALSHWLTDMEPSANVTYQSITASETGWFFYFHMAVCYSMIAYMSFRTLVYLYRNSKTDKDVFPFLFILIAILVAVVLNIIHIFVFQFYIDPTYISFVVLTTVFYFIIYIRDIRLILLFNQNVFILDNLREMYFVVNQRNEIIDASESFGDLFVKNPSQSILFDDWLLGVQDRVVVFTDSKDLKMRFNPEKRYLHMQMKEIFIPLFKYTGKFYLFYDETEHQQFINDMDFVRTHDLMTGLYNRNYFEEIKPDIDSRNQSYALILFDVDGLKLYNDYLGHNSGDNLLIRFAIRLKEVGDRYRFTAIRMGGDEFLLLALNMNIKMIEASLDEIIGQLSGLKEENNILFSYGYAERESHGENLERVVSRADKRMYNRKLANKEAKSVLKAKLKAESEEMNMK